MNAPAYRLMHDSKHLKTNDDDAILMPFEGQDYVCGWVGTEYCQVPNPVLFEANFQVTRQSDYPCNDVNWPLMSPRMLEVLSGVGDFPHRRIPVRLVDRSTSGSRRYLPDGSLRPEVLDDRFVALQLTEHIDVVDWERSTFRPRRSNPNGVWFSKLVVREPPGGLPPLFRIAAEPMLLVSAAARRALEGGGIIGITFMSIPGAHQVDASS
jgi:hypothetical protein